MTFRDLVREKFPDVTDDQADMILWEHTGFPGFFHGDPVTALRSQLTALATLGPVKDEDWRRVNLLDLSVDVNTPPPYPSRRLIPAA